MAEAKKTVADADVFHRAFSRRKPIEVDAPELGEGVVVRFRKTFRVADVLAVVSVPQWQSPMVLDLLLARLALVDADGNDVVDQSDDDWFQKGADGILLHRLSRRAKLREAFMLAFRAKEGEPSGKELTEESLRQTIADLSVAMKLPQSRCAAGR